MKKKSWWIASCVGILMFSNISLGLTADLKDQPQALQNFVAEETNKNAAIGFHAVDLSTGKTIAAYNENISIVPASTMKVVTTAAALELLGKDYQFETRLLYDGTISNGVLKGNIYIKGMGDPTLGSDGVKTDKDAFLKDWAETMKKAGIKSVDGKVIVLDDLFGYVGVPGKWLYEDFGASYGAGTYGVSVYDNIYTIYLKTGADGTPAQLVKTDPPTPGLKIENTIKAVENAKRNLSISGIPLDPTRRLSGVLPTNQEEAKIKSDIPDPGLFLAIHFTNYLKENGIKVKGNPTTARLTKERPITENVLTITKSVPLSEIVKVLMSRSDNHYAEHLYEFVKTEKKTTVTNFWKEKGFDTNALVMHDGSGMSPQDALNVKFLTDILVYMDKPAQADYKYKNLLPIVGQEGTVKTFLKDGPLEGKAFVKTGSFSGVQSYAGYVEVDGKRYAFAITVNNWSGSRADLRTNIEKLLNDLFAPAVAKQAKKAA